MLLTIKIKKAYFFFFIILLTCLTPGLFAQSQDDELKKIKQELKDLSDIRYKNLIELKKEQRKINKRINRLQYSIKFRTDSIFNLISNTDINTGNQTSLVQTENKIRESLNGDIKKLKKEFEAEIGKANTNKTGMHIKPITSKFKLLQ